MNERNYSAATQPAYATLTTESKGHIYIQTGKSSIYNSRTNPRISKTDKLPIQQMYDRQKIGDVDSF
jgi:hypothetical protein